MYNPYQKNGNLNTNFHLSCLYNKINLYLLFLYYLLMDIALIKQTKL